MSAARKGTAAKQPKSAKEPKKQGLWKRFRGGSLVSVDVFKRNGWLIVLILVVVISLMGLRYKTKVKMEQIQHLRSELQRSESEKLREKAEYMSLIRESEMRRLVNEKGLDLRFREAPPYEISHK